MTRSQRAAWNPNACAAEAPANDEAKKLLQNSSKKDHLRVNVTGTKNGDTIQVQSLSMS